MPLSSPSAWASATYWFRNFLLLSICWIPASITGAPPLRATIERISATSGRIEFPTEIGATYVVEESSNLTGDWTPATQIVADEATEHLDVVFPPGDTARFWRVVRLDGSGEVTISPILALYDELPSGPSAAFEVTATSPRGIDAVLFYSGGLLRGSAMRGASDLWTYSEAFDPDVPQALALSATAEDQDGNTASTSTQSFLLADPARFVPVEGDGTPQPGRFVKINGDGTLAAFEFRPDGHAPAAKQSGLRIRIDPGARFQLQDGQYVIIFRQATIRRGWHDDQPQTVDAASDRVLPVIGLQPGELATAMGLDPAAPVPLHLFPGTTLLWQDGPLGPTGLDGADVNLDWTNDGAAGLNLGGDPDQSRLTVNPVTGEPQFELVYHGDFELGDGLQIAIPAQAPWVFRFQSDGRVALSGETRVTLPNGGTVHGSVAVRNGRYCFTLTAANLTVGTLDSLVGLLPPDPSACVPGTTDDLQMQIAASCLEAYRRSYRNLVAGAVRIDATDISRTFANLPDPVDGGRAVAEAWAWRLVALAAEDGNAQIDAAMQEILGELGDYAVDTAVAEFDLAGLLDWNRTLTRLERALAAAGIGSLRDRLDPAQAELMRAFELRLAEADPIAAASTLGEVLNTLLETESLHEEWGDSTTADDFRSLAAGVIETFGPELRDELGIEDGITDPSLNDTVQALGRSATATALRTVVDLWALAQCIDSSNLLDALQVEEAVQQLVGHLEDLHDTELDLALDERDLAQALLVSLQRVELMDLLKEAGLADSVSSFMDPASLRARWDAMADQLLNNPVQEWRRDTLRDALRHLTQSLEYAPERAADHAPGLRDEARARLDGFLATGTGAPSLTPDDWLQWLAVGLQVDRLGRRHFTSNFLADDPGLGNRSRLAVLVDGLIMASGGDPSGGPPTNPAQLQHAFIDQAAGWLHAEASVLATEAADPSLSPTERQDRQERRLTYLQSLGTMLRSYQAIATSIFSDAATRPGTAAFLGDLLLPGDIVVHDLAGAACLDTNTGAFHGRFSGDVALPRFDGRLTVPNASFDSLGNVDLSAFGTATFPADAQGAGGQVTITVSQRRPLSLGVLASGRFALSGGARLALPGGHTVDGFLSIDDPYYIFELSYGGALRLDLLDSVTALRPVLNLDPDTPLDLGLADSLARYYGALGTGYETLVETAPAFPSAASLDPGRPPEFQNPTITIATDAIDAWIASTANEQVIDRLNGSLDSTVAGMRGLLKSISEELKASREETESRLVRIQRLRKRAMQLEEVRKAIKLIEQKHLAAETESAALLEQLSQSVEALIVASDTVLDGLPPDATPAERFAAINLHIDAYSTAATLGVDQPFDTGTYHPVIAAGVDELRSATGLGPDGEIINAAKFNTVSDVELHAIAKVFLDISANLETLALPGDTYLLLASKVLTHLRDRKLAAYAKAVQAGDLGARAVNAIWLMEFNREVRAGIIDAPNDEITENFDAFHDTLLALQDRRSGPPTVHDEVLALARLDVARASVLAERSAGKKRYRELEGRPKQLARFFADETADERRFEERSLPELIAINWEVLGEAGLLDPAKVLAQRTSLANWFGAYFNALETNRLTDLDFVETNTRAAQEGLVFGIDAIAFAREHLGDEAPSIPQWEATWRAVHLEWIGVAEARHAWWALSAYTSAISEASNRYGTGLAGASLAGAQSAGTEALAALESTLVSMTTLANGIDLEEFNLPLPGDLQIERLFGHLDFNRVSGEWAVTFGGAARFPAASLAFELEPSTLRSDGSFTLGLNTSGPVPFGTDSSLTIDVQSAFNLTGNLLTPVIDGAAVEGQVLIRRTPESGGVETYEVDLAYSYEDPGHHSLTFSSTAEGDIKAFTEDLVIFRGGLSLSVDIDEFGSLTQTDFTASTEVGVFAKELPYPGDPDPDTLSIDDFELAFTGSAGLSSTPEQTIVTIGPGTLFLPEEFQARPYGQPGSPEPGVNRPFVTIPANGPLTFTYRSILDPDPALRDTIAFAGSLSFEDLRFSIPQIDDLWVDVLSLTLNFGFDSAQGLPTATLSDVAGQVSVPRPGGNPLRAGIEVGNWSLDRLPESGSIFLTDDLTILDTGGFRFAARGGTMPPLFETPYTGITLFTDPDTGRPAFTISGSFQGTASGWFTDRAGNPQDIVGRQDGSVTVVWPEDPATLGLDDFTFDLQEFSVSGTGEFLFGGTDSLAVIDPKLTISNPLYALRPTQTNPFIIGLDLGIRIASAETPYAFTIQGERMQVIFDGSPDAPLVNFGALGGCLETNDINGGETVEMMENLPLHIRKFCLRFKNQPGTAPVPLFPADPQQMPFSFRNTEILLSADIRLPFAQGGGDVFTASVNDLLISSDNIAPNASIFANNLPTLSLDGIELGFDLSSYLGDKFPFGGTLYVGGFADQNYYFAGKVLINVKGYLVDGIVAFDMQGFRGLCFGLAGAEASIPLAYGFVLTGARGGIALGDGAVDPCDFVALMKIDRETGRPSPDGPPGPNVNPCETINWAELQALHANRLDRDAFLLRQQRANTAERLVVEEGLDSDDAAAEVATLDAAGLATRNDRLDAAHADSICPTPGTCPPASLGLLAQPHPDSFLEGSDYEGRAIFKFTSIDEPLLNFLGITRAAIDARVPTTGLPDPRVFAAEIAEELRHSVDAMIPRPPDDLPAPLPDWAASFENTTRDLLDKVQLGFFNSLECAMDNLPADRAQLVDALYNIIVEAAYAGVPYDDLTLRIEGSFSYLGVSSFASVTGGVMISTSGTMGVNGSVNLFGVPFGYLRAYETNFDAYGNRSIGLCGEMDIAVGPLEFGTMSGILDAGQTETRVLTEFGTLAGGLAGDVFTNDYVYEKMLRIAPKLAMDKDTPAATHLNALTTSDQKFNFLAAVMGDPPRLGGGDPTPQFREFAIGLADALDLRLALCGAVELKAFGMPLNGGNALVASKAYLGPVDPTDLSQGYRLFVGDRMSPTQLFAQSLLATSGAGIAASLFIPAVDQAERQMATEISGTPAMGGDSARGALGTILDEAIGLPPTEFLNRRVENFTDSTITTVSYEISPFGLKLFRTGGRMVFPSYDHHPLGGDPRTPPDERGSRLPGKEDVLAAALSAPGPENSNLLADALWRGDSADLADLFAGTKFEAPVNAAIQNDGTLELVDDYFPHGGFLGAAEFTLPRLLTEGLPDSYFVMIDPTADWLGRFAALGGFLTDVTTADTAGGLWFYLPAPNPPSILADGFPATLNDLLTDLRTYDPSVDAAALYPIDEAYLRGVLDVKLLGLPLGESTLEMVPDETLYRVTSTLPSNSWLGRMTGRSELVAEIRQGVNADLPMDDVLLEWLRAFEGLATQNPSNSEREQLVEQITDELARRMPRVSVNYANGSFQVPLPGYDPSGALGSGEVAMTINKLEFAAYSPQFAPAHSGDTPFDRIRREGGIGFRGSFDFNQSGLQVAGGSAEFAIDPRPSAFGTPSFSGEFTASSLSLGSGGILQLAGDATGTISADTDGLTISLDASADTIDLGLFRLVPPTGGARTVPVVAALTADQNGFGSARFEIGPAALHHPAFGEDMEVRIHGASPSEPFSLDTGGTWNATATVSDPALELEVGGTIVARLRGAGLSDFTGSVHGDGADITELLLSDLPDGLIVETYPDLPRTDDVRKNIVTIGPAASGSLSLRPSGGFRLVIQNNDSATKSELSNVVLQPGYTVEVTESSFSLDAKVVSIPIANAGFLRPRTGDGDSLLSLSASGSITGALEFSLERCRLDFALPMVQTDALLDGGSPLSDLTFRTSGAWSARLRFRTLTLDPDGPGTNVPEFLEMSAPDPDNPIATIDVFTTTVSGTGLSSVNFNATRSGPVTLAFLGSTPFARSYTNTKLGSQSLSFNSAGSLEFRLDNNDFGNFNAASIPTGTGNASLLSVDGSAKSDLVIDNDGLSLSLVSPTISIAGETLIRPGTFTASFSSSGAFSASVRTTDDTPLFGNVLELRAGTHSLSANANNINQTLAVSTLGRFNLKVPTLSGTTVGSTTLSHDFDLSFNANTAFSHTWDPSPNSTGFDLGWLRVDAGGAGRVRASLDGSGFSVAVENWDLYLFGNDNKFNDAVDVAFSSSGYGSVSLGNATINIAEGLDNALRLVTSTPVAFNWNAGTGGITFEIPTATEISLPGAGLLSGNLVNGLDIRPITMSAAGTFDQSFSSDLNINGAEFSSTTMRFRRTTPNGNIIFEGNLAMDGDFAGANLDLYVSTSGTLRIRLTGSLVVPFSGFAGTWAGLDGDFDGDLDLASLSLNLTSNPSRQFQGTARISGTTFTVSIGSKSAYVAPSNVVWANFPLPLLPVP